MPDVISWTRPLLERFKKTYAEAARAGDPGKVFVFEGHDFVCSYARYLIEFLEGQL